MFTNVTTLAILLVSAGIACIIAAVVGGGVSAVQITIPVLKEKSSRISLGVVGSLLIIGGLYTTLPSTDGPPRTPEPPNPPRTTEAPVNDGVVYEAFLRADPFNYSGQCPKRIIFSGRISVVRATTVVYKFTRSDGANAPVQSLKFDGPGSQNVEDYWQLGASGMNYSGWEQIKIIDPPSPNLKADQAEFTIQCQ